MSDNLILSADPMIAASQRFDHYSAQARTYRRCARNAASINNRGATRYFQRKAREAAAEARAALAALQPKPVERPVDVDPLAPMAALLEYAGWELKDVDVSVGPDRATLRVHVARYNEDRIALHVDLLVEGHLGRASISRDLRHFNERQRGGTRYTGGWDCHFIGRDRFADPRAALLAFQGYVEDNGNGRRIGTALTSLIGAHVPSRALARRVA